MLLLSACIRHFAFPSRCSHLHPTVRVSATPAMPSARDERTATSASTAWLCTCATLISVIPSMRIKLIRGACQCGSTLSSPKIRDGEPQPYGPHDVDMFITVPSHIRTGSSSLPQLHMVAPGVWYCFWAVLEPTQVRDKAQLP